MLRAAVGPDRYPCAGSGVGLEGPRTCTRRATRYIGAADSEDLAEPIPNVAAFGFAARVGQAAGLLGNSVHTSKVSETRLFVAHWYPRVTVQRKTIPRIDRGLLHSYEGIQNDPLPRPPPELPLARRQGGSQGMMSQIAGRPLPVQFPDMSFLGPVFWVTTSIRPRWLRCG
jgi:hypothetical protein